MRDLINLVEDAQAWPETISSADLLKYAKEWHQTSDDFENGDIVHNIMSYDVYHLRRMPLDGLDLEGFTIDDDKVSAYADLSTEAPPIIVGQWGMILDGNHRANAAAKRGEEDILAYVGEPKRVVVK